MIVLFRRRKSLSVTVTVCALVLSLASAFVIRPFSCRYPTRIQHDSPLQSTTITSTVYNNVTPKRSSTSLTMANKTQGKRRLAATMAFLCGWADIALFSRYKTFATMMTGNTLWAMIAVAENRYRDVLYYTSVILSYLGGLAVFRKTDLSLKKQSLPLSAVLVTTLFCASEYIHSMTQGAQWIPMLLLAAGYGVINSVGSEIAGTLTFVITGHMTRLTNSAVTRSLSSQEEKKPLTPGEKYASIENAAVLLGFVGGALWASLFRRMLRSTEFVLLGVLHGASFLSQDMEAIGGAWWLRKYFCEDVVGDDGSVCDVGEEDFAVIPDMGNSTSVGDAAVS